MRRYDRLETGDFECGRCFSIRLTLRSRARVGAMELVGVDVNHLATSAKLIYGVYEVDPLKCATCDREMRVIALIHDPSVIQRML